MMETITCWWCDEFSTRGKKESGYCGAFDRPIWKSTVKKCQEEALTNAGPFCYHCCPFSDDGYLCGDESPGVKSIYDCPNFDVYLNEALGGSGIYEFAFLNEKTAEVVVVEIGISFGIYRDVNEELTCEYRWHFGWTRWDFTNEGEL